MYVHSRTQAPLNSTTIKVADTSLPDNGSAYGTLSTIFNFDIPTSTKGKTCSIQFLFPDQSALETSSYTLSGDGVFKFAMLDGLASSSTTFATSPKVVTDYGSFSMSPGNAYDVASIPCPAGEAIGVWIHTTGDSVLDYFQDYNLCRECFSPNISAYTDCVSQQSACMLCRSEHEGCSVCDGLPEDTIVLIHEI